MDDSALERALVGHVSCATAARLAGVAPKSVSGIAKAGRIRTIRTDLGPLYRLEDVARYAEHRATRRQGRK